MARLLVFAICSVDLRTTDADGDFSWAEPTEEVHRFANDLERATGTALYGRRMWETMRFWQTVPEDEPSVMSEYGRLWRAKDKVVYSRTLTGIDEPRVRLESRFDPASVRAFVDAQEADVSVSGSELAGQALRAGIVNDLHLLLAPVVIGAGPRAIPDDLRADLVLQDHRTFDGGWAALRYSFA